MLRAGLIIDACVFVCVYRSVHLTKVATEKWQTYQHFPLRLTKGRDSQSDWGQMYLHCVMAGGWAEDKQTEFDIIAYVCMCMFPSQELKRWGGRFTEIIFLFVWDHHSSCYWNPGAVRVSWCQRSITTVIRWTHHSMYCRDPVHRTHQDQGNLYPRNSGLKWIKMGSGGIGSSFISPLEGALIVRKHLHSCSTFCLSHGSGLTLT